MIGLVEHRFAQPRTRVARETKLPHDVVRGLVYAVPVSLVLWAAIMIVATNLL